MAKDRKIDMVILGLLAHEDRTGYDIKKQIDGGIRFFWKGSFGSIYPALAQLEEEGSVRRSGSNENGGREKIVYSITDQGKEVLKAWLRDEKSTNDLKYESIMKIFFGGAEDRKITLQNIDLFQSQIEADLKVLQFYKKNLEKVLDQEDHIYFYLTVMFGIKSYEAYLRWCADSKKILSQRRRGE
ncbi:MAG: PadR family transcriptional regulator [Clostridiales bacterium]|nr:PadR family transcriptional regulator [Clostridiales bacterium]